MWHSKHAVLHLLRTPPQGLMGEVPHLGFVRQHATPPKKVAQQKPQNQHNGYRSTSYTVETSS